TGPRAVTAPVSSTAYRLIPLTSAGTSLMFKTILVPLSSRRIVATPFDLVSVTGFRLIFTSLPTGYSITVKDPSGCCTVLVTVVGVCVTVVVVGSCANARALDESTSMAPANSASGFLLIRTPSINRRLSLELDAPLAGAQHMGV